MMVDSGGTGVLLLPNESRVTRFMLLLQNLLYSFHTICEYWDKNPNFKPLVLPRVVWQKIAKFDTIMQKACSLFFESQSDRSDTSAKMISHLAMVDVTH